MINLKVLLVAASAAVGAIATFLLTTEKGKDMINKPSELEKELRADFAKLAKES